MKTIALGFLATAIAATTALAGDEVSSKDYKQAPPVAVPCFKDQELQLDLFGTFMNMPYGRDRFEGRDRDGGGGGVGVNYFFTRYIGIGVDGDFTSNHDGVANYTGKLILRYPIEAGGFCIAPYVFGGGGGESFFDDNHDGFGFRPHNRDNTVGAWMCGGGLEWRVTPRFGIFAEGRFTWTDSHKGDDDNDRARLGLRLAF